MLKLHVVPSHDDSFEFEVTGDELVIGRSTRSDVSVPDRFLSRQHARLFRSGEDWKIEDLGSRNGTYVNGTRITEPTEINPGDIITMSESRIDVYREGEQPPESVVFPGIESVLRPATELLSMSTVMPSAEQDPSGETVRRLAQRLSILNEVHHALAESIALDELLDLILERAFEHLRPQQGAIYLKRPDGGLDVAALRPLDLESEGFPLSKSLCHEVVDKGMAARVNDVMTDDRFSEAESLLGTGIRSLVAAPLAHSKGTLGMIVLSSSADYHVFSEGDMDLLTSLASVAALRIRNLALAEEAAERRRLHHEVALARQIQMALIPDELPAVAGYEIYGGNNPSQGVSGDYFEVIERLDGEECVFFIADVSGKGIAASLLTAYIEALSTVPIEEGLSPDDVFESVSRRLFRRTPHERFATAFLAVLDPTTGRVTYANAGHNPTLVMRRDGAAEWLGSTGIPLGLMPVADYARAEVDLQGGDIMVMYTDGIVEAVNRSDEEYESTRLEQACRRYRDRSLDELASLIQSDLDEFAEGVPFADDRTLVMVRRSAVSSDPA